jgi:hypothetical protein
MHVGNTARVSPTPSRSAEIKSLVKRYEHYATPRSFSFSRAGMKFFVPGFIVSMALMPVGGTATVYSTLETYGIQRELSRLRKENNGFKSRVSVILRSLGAAFTMLSVPLLAATKASALLATPFFQILGVVLFGLGIGLFAAEKAVRTIKAGSTAKQLAAAVKSQGSIADLILPMMDLKPNVHNKLTVQLRKRGVVI